MKHAILPEGMADIDHSIASMDIGDSGWTVPWAMYHEADRKLWLHGGYTIHRKPGGTVQMRVWRDEEGWHADISQCTCIERLKFGWNGYVGKVTPIRVVTLTGA